MADAEYGLNAVVQAAHLAQVQRQWYRSPISPAKPPL